MAQHRSIILPNKSVKTVLIITYYWPPAGGPGVQRVLKFAKYLPQFGWRPVILTVKNGEYPAMDHSLAKDIPEDCMAYKTASLEPNALYRRFVGMKHDETIGVAVLTEENQNWKKKISNWVRLNIFIPDAKIGWKPIAVHQGKNIIKNLKPDIILSSSPPPTVHLIAQKLAQWSGLKWVADFRDPWTNIYHYHNTPKCRFSKAIDAKLEQKVLARADQIVTVTEGFFNKTDPNRMHIIPNGFDPEDYQILNTTPLSTPGEVFTICYMGSLKTRQYIDSFFQVLTNIQQIYSGTRMKIQIKFIGRVDPAIVNKIKQKDIGLSPIFTGYLDHTIALKQAAQADMLLLIIGKSHIANRILTGKLFEYLMLRKPILAYGPLNGAVHQVLTQTKAGQLFNYDDLPGPRQFIINQFQKWENNETTDANIQNLNKYNRIEQTKQLANIFEELL